MKAGECTCLNIRGVTSKHLQMHSLFKEVDQGNRNKIFKSEVRPHYLFTDKGIYDVDGRGSDAPRPLKKGG
jgi:hypothetical protein